MRGRLILIAHAETEATRSAAFPDDEPLTDKGRTAAARYAPTLPRHDRVWRSPATAAKDTAAAFDFDATVEPALADLDCGLWRGRTLDALAASDPDGLATWLTNPAYAGHGGHAIDDLLVRVDTWLALRRDDRGTVIAITHAAVVRCAVLATLGAQTIGFWRLDVAPLARLDLGSDGRRWTLRQLVQADLQLAVQK